MMTRTAEQEAADDDGRAWFDKRLLAFVAALRRDASGRARAAVERPALAPAARDMVERIGWGDDPMSRAQTLNADVLHPNQLLANTFQVRGLIAKGGVGEIYRARHRDLRSEHTIKIL